VISGVETTDEALPLPALDSRRLLTCVAFYMPTLTVNETVVSAVSVGDKLYDLTDCRFPRTTGYETLRGSRSCGRRE